MAKTANTEPAGDAAVAAPASKVTLTEFCMRLSMTVKRPELLRGFEHTEKVAGRKQDTEAAFKARFDAFINTPV